MPPHVGAGVEINWGELERAWGTPFPDDYKEFMRNYGPGAIENFLAVFQPGISEAGLPEGYMADETSVAQEVWEDLGGIPGIDAEPGQLLAWASDGTADLLFWLRGEGSPDDWPVVVYERDEDAWNLYDCGMAEFLVGIFRAQFPQHPLSGTPMWGTSAPRFLTAAEESRISAAGRDPWS
ncbi:SMI1/KNR4 family protein [Streptomyces termitum]